MSVGTVRMVSADMLYIFPSGFILPLSSPLITALGKSSSATPTILGSSP